MLTYINALSLAGLTTIKYPRKYFVTTNPKWIELRRKEQKTHNAISKKL